MLPFLSCITPVINSPTPTNSICTNTIFTTNLVSTPVGANYSWTSVLVTGITGHQGTGIGNINETLVNTTSSPLTVVYNITPYLGACFGTLVTYSVTINPIPSLNSLAVQAVCSGANVSSVIFTSTPVGATFLG